MSPALERTLPTMSDAKAVMRLAWPVMVSRLSTMVMLTADTLFLAKLGTAPLAAMGVALPASFVPIAAATGAVGGLRTLVASSVGARDDARVKLLGWQAIWIGLGLGTLAAILGLFARPIFDVIGGGTNAANLAADYFRVRMFGGPVELLFIALGGWFQGKGETRTPMLAALVANALNIPLDAMFIFGFGPIPAMGVAGAAWGSVFALTVGLGLLLWRARALFEEPRGPDPATLRAVLSIGGPMSLQEGLDVLSWSLFTMALARLGDSAMAAHVIVIRIASLSFLPGRAIGDATSVLVGQHIGARTPRGALRSLRAGVGLTLLMMVTLGTTFVVMPGPFLAVFSPTAEVDLIARQLFWVAAVLLFFDAFAMPGLSALQGVGDTRFTLIAVLAPCWLVKLPLGFALAHTVGWGAMGAWIGLTAEVITIAILAMWRLQSGAWLRSARRLAAA
jgi:MATE family multidrug resistance protein